MQGELLVFNFLQLSSLAQGEQEHVREVDLVGMTQTLGQRQMSVKVDLHQQQRLKEMVGEEAKWELARLLSLTTPLMKP